MAYDDTRWGGFAKIIVDTSTMTVGDTVRVKSVTTGTNYDKQVVTVGTPLIWETEIFKDYVKICRVQDIMPVIKINTVSTGGNDASIKVSMYIGGNLVQEDTLLYSDVQLHRYSNGFIGVEYGTNEWRIYADKPCTYNGTDYALGDWITYWGYGASKTDETFNSKESVPTEIGGVYKEADYGETLFINVLDKTSLAGIQGILNAHQETTLLNVGDEVNIIVSGSPVTFQIAHINPYNSHEIYFVAKNIYSMTTANADYTSTSSGVRPVMQSFYNSIANNDRQYIKETSRKCQVLPSGTVQAKQYTDYVFALEEKEVGGTNVTVTGQIKFDIFTSQDSRVKTYGGTAGAWWLADASSSSASYRVVSNGSVSTATASGSTHGVVPAFRLTADS